ncbi:MAG: hypothetical protein EOP87_02075, partial [Verrucomicrobiaceae bacterium]
MYRFLPIVLLLVVSLGWGIWVGEDVHAFLGLSQVGLIGGMVLLVLGFALPRRVLRRVGLAVGVSGLLVSGYFIGDHRGTAAFNGCVLSGENVRQALADHRRRTGSFPAKLADLVQPLPGGRILRGSLLEYRRV